MPTHENQTQHLLRPSVANAKTKTSHERPHSPFGRTDETGTDGVTKDVALKLIPRKKVKGNEESVWGEMEVLKGLDHPNIVSDI
jgi:calcium/calmodulin-dependent protein kinase I